MYILLLLRKPNCDVNVMVFSKHNLMSSRGIFYIAAGVGNVVGLDVLKIYCEQTYK
jgi:hypothetical protein